MEFTAEMIAGFLGGDILGDKNASVHTVSSIEEGKAGSLAYLTNPKYEPFLYTTGASIVLVDRSFEPAQPVAATLIKVDDAAACVVKLLSMYNAAKPRRKGISDRASISEKAQVGEECYIGDLRENRQELPDLPPSLPRTGRNGRRQHDALSRCEDLRRLLRRGELHPPRRGRDRCRRIRIHAQCRRRIRQDPPAGPGGFDKIPQLGNVIIEDDVEIGANTCIDRAKTDSTIIRRGVKLDNLIQIGHNVQIGENTVSSAQTGIAGTSRVGRHDRRPREGRLEERYRQERRRRRDPPRLPRPPGHAVPPFVGRLQEPPGAGAPRPRARKTDQRTPKIKKP